MQENWKVESSWGGPIIKLYMDMKQSSTKNISMPESQLVEQKSTSIVMIMRSHDTMARSHDKKVNINLSINQTSIAPISPAKPDSVA